MKIAHAEQHVLGSHGLTNTSSFKIQTNAHAFKLLSSGLYSDKIAAVLREIGCNAADAHIEFGTPNLPIVVKLPNRLDNQFYIRDMGPGLSHDDVMNLYTTYFASTKQNSNDYTGAFGLGSKSPFSYTDNFTVTSVHNGVERSYSAYLDNKGSPTISKLTENPASPDWQHGVQIGFPVKPDDFSTFEARAQNIYRWFNVLPRIEGARPIQLVTAKYVDPAGDFEYHPGNINGQAGAIIMGNVFYPIDLQKLGVAYNHYGQNDQLLSFAHFFKGFVLRFKIGEVQVAASREELQYDDDSRKAIKIRLAKMITFLGNSIAEELRKAQTWEEKCAARSTTKMWGVELGHSGWLDLFKALKLPDAASLAGLATAERVTLPPTMGRASVSRVITKSNFTRRHNLNRVKPGDHSTVHLHAKTHVFYGERNLSLLRVKNLLDTNQADQVLLFTPDKDRGFIIDDAITDAFDTAIALGIPQARDLSTISLPASYVPPPKKKYVKKGGILPPLPSVDVTTISVGFANLSKIESHKVDLLKADMQNFMVLAKVSGWRYRDRIRVYDKTAETDLMMEPNEWKEIWSTYSMLAKEIDAPFKGYVLVSAAEVSKLDLVKRGWKTTYVAIKDWLQEPATQKAIVAAAANWKPSMRLEAGHTGGWAGELVVLKNDHPEILKKLKPLLKEHKLLGQIEQIHETSVKQGTNAGTKEPRVITAYRSLATTFDLPAITVKQSNGGFISVEDFNKSILDRFPLSITFDYTDFRRICEVHPEDAEKFLKFILSKEK